MPELTQRPRYDYAAQRRARLAAMAEARADDEAWMRAQDPPLPTDAEVAAMLAHLEPCRVEHEAREADKARWSV